MYNKISTQDRIEKLHALCMDDIDAWGMIFPMLVHQWWQHHQTNNNHPQPEKLTAAPSAANNNISAQDRAANVMLFAWAPLITSFNDDDNNSIKQSTIMLNGIKKSNNNQPQLPNFNTTPSTSKRQHQCSRESHKCHALCMNALNPLFWWQWQQQYQTINNYAQQSQKQQATNKNQPQSEKVNTTPSASKWQRQCSRQSQKCHALCMNALDCLV